MYSLMYAQMKELIESNPSPLSCMANMSSLIFHTLPDLNWAGFYLTRGEELLLGPFQGKVACTRIPWGKGVCGTAAASRSTQLVSDVHAFPGHIACDSASNAEIVVPLIREGRVLGVLDIDSPSLNRFDREDQAGLEALCALLVDRADWDGGLL